MEPLTLGEYELQSMWGWGATANVFRATHRPTGIECAVKVIHPSRVQSASTRRAFARELRTAAALRHPNVVQIHDHGQVDAATALASRGQLAPNSPYVVLEAFPGGDLGAWRGRIPWPMLREAIHAVLAGLAHAHARGVLHRDLKPTNLLLDRSLELVDARVALADFGIARVLDLDPTQADDAYLGTPQYSPPEQAFGSSADLGPWTDLYALGCTIWALCCGHAPFSGGSLPALLAAHDAASRGEWAPLRSYPQGLLPWLDRALQRRIDDRFASAAEAQEAWRRIDPTPPDPVAPLPPPSPLALSTRMFGLREIPVVGREVEQAALRAALDQAIGGRARVVVLAGPAGTGKSRLARWLCEQAETTGSAQILRIDHVRRGGAGHGLGPALDRRLRTHGREGEELQDRLVAALSRLQLTDRAELGMTLETLRPGSLDPPPRGSERRAVLRLVLTALARSRPLVLWLDDVQFGPQSTAVAAGLPPDAPILVVATVRSDLLRAGSPAANTLDALTETLPSARIDVGPLVEAQARRLIEELLLVRGDVAERVAQRAGGNPLFATQLVADLVARGALRWGPDGYVADADQPLPPDLRQLWLDRVDAVLQRQPATASEALELAAALGDLVEQSEWNAACESWGIDRPINLPDALAEGGVLRSVEDGLRFEHSLAREAIIERASEAGRWAAVCSAVADALARLRPVDPRLAPLLLDADRPADAVVPALAAATAVAQTGDHGLAMEAIALADAALDRLAAPPQDPRRLELVLVQGECLRLQSKYADALALVDAVPVQAAAEGNRRLLARAQHLVGVLRRMTGDADGAGVALDAAVHEWRQLGDVVEEIGAIASRLQLRSLTHGRAGNEATLREALERLPDTPAAKGTRNRLRRLLATELQDRDPVESMQLLHLAVAHAREALLLHQEARLQLHLAHGYRRRRLYEDALAAGMRMLELARRSAHDADEVDAYGTIADVYASNLQYERADEWYELAIAAMEAKASLWIGVVLGNQARMWIEQGRFEDAAPRLARAVTSFEALVHRPAANYCRLLLLRCAIEARDADAVEEHLAHLEASTASVEDAEEAGRWTADSVVAARRWRRPELAERIERLMGTLGLEEPETVTQRRRR